MKQRLFHTAESCCAEAMAKNVQKKRFANTKDFNERHVVLFIFACSYTIDRLDLMFNET